MPLKRYKRVITAIAVMLATLTASGGEPMAQAGTPALKAADVFANAPLEVLDMLRNSTRLDMLDYFQQADSIFPATDALGGTSRIETLTDDYMRVAITPVSRLEIKLLPFKKGEIVMTLYTTGSDGMARDTEVAFFDREMKPLDSSGFLKGPVMKDFFGLKGSDVSAKELRERIPFDAIEYSTGPGSAPLTATFTTLCVLSEEDRKDLEPLLKGPLQANWNLKAFDF